MSVASSIYKYLDAHSADFVFLWSKLIPLAACGENSVCNLK